MGFDLGGSSNSFPFETVGARVAGSVLEVTEQQQTDLDTGEPAYWQSGQPKMLIKVVLQTELKDAATDDGKRSVYLKGSKKPESKSSLAAVIEALRTATGGTELEIGGKLSLTYIGDGEKTNRAFNAPKLYSATYEAPKVNLAGSSSPAPPTIQEPEGSGAQSAPFRPPTAVSSPVQGSPAPLPTPGPSSPTGAVIGWLNGQAITPDMEAAFKAIGTDPRTMPGFIPAGDQPPF